jgi:protein-arginine kinase activator protein McsA
MKTKTIGFKVKNGKRTETFYQEPKQETLEEFAKQEAVKQYSEDTFGNLIVRKSIEKGAKWQRERMYSEEDMIAFGKSCFYKGFDKAENDDANCYTAFREEIGSIIEQFKNK